MTGRGQESGVVLVNVLVVLAIAGGLMFLLISTQEAALDRVGRAVDASVAEQIAFGAEASVVDALRRDLDTRPEADHFNEPWALSVVQDEVALPTGKFSVKITDLQAKFDINQLSEAALGTQEFASRLMVATGQPPEAANQIVRILGVIGRVAQLEDLAAFGVSSDTLDALKPYVTALPVVGTINLNTVDPLLLSVMMKNTSQATQLVRLREGRGFVTLDDLNNAGVLRPQNSGFTSNAYHVVVLAQAGAAEIKMESVMIRRNALGVKAVEILERKFIYDAPDPLED